MSSTSLWPLGIWGAVLAAVLLGAGPCTATTPTPTATPGFEFCPLDLEVTPNDVPAGAQVGVQGRCYWLHSGRAGQVYFDHVLVGEVRGDTSGNFAATIRLPLRTTAGDHVVRIPVGGGLELRGDVHIEGAPEGCPGDCDHDDVVQLDELVQVVDIFLGKKPAEMCPAVDRNQNGTATVDEVVASVNSALRGCPALLSAASLAAAYDVSAAFTLSGERAGLGSVREPAAGMIGIDIDFDPLSSLHVGGALGADGAAVLEGYRIEGGDIASFAHGTARAVLRPGMQRIVGELDIDAGIGNAAEHVTFTMERPERGTPLVRTYGVALTHVPAGGGAPYESSLGLLVDIADNGFGTCSGGDHYDEHSVQLPILDPAACELTPQGRFKYTTSYTSDTGESPPVIFFLGTLSRDSGPAGSGVFHVGGFPVVIEQGTWAATANF